MLNIRAFSPVLAAALLVACSGDKPTEVAAPSVFNIEPGAPAGWNIMGSISDNFVVGLDHVTRHGGSTALHIASNSESMTEFQGISQAIRADAYRGKRIWFTAWVKHANLYGPTAGLWMRIDGDFQTLRFDNYSYNPLLGRMPLYGTSDWHEVGIILDVPNEAVGIKFGVLMAAKGELLADDLRIRVLPLDGPTTNTLSDVLPSTFDAIAYYDSIGMRPIVNLDFEQR